MSTEADVVAPGIGLPEGDETEQQTLWQRAVGNVKSGNLGVLPVVIGEVLIVTYFSFTATNFFTAGNFVNVILQMAGVTMIAFGVVFVLLIAEIDLSIGYLSGIAALTAATLQLPDGRNYPGWLCILLALGVVAIIGAAQGTVVAKVGVPSFVVTLAGLLIWQGVILRELQVRGVIQIEEDWINKTATYYFSATVSWIIAALVTGLYALVALSGLFGQQRAGLKVRPLPALAKLVGVAVAAFGVVAICTHATKPAACPEGTPLAEVCTQPLGLPLAAVLMLVFLVGLTFLAKRTTFGRHVYAVGGNAEAARRAGINVARVRILVFMISGIMAGVGGLILAARLQSVNLNVGGGTLLLDSISAAVIGGVSLFGGRGEVRGALFGSLIIATIANGLNIGGYKTGTIYIVTGAILLGAVTLDTVARRLQERSGR
ncbi:MAG: Xylose transporter, permease protein XylH [Gaiellaceae bacterium]|jgi:D-xylose transport system permease protein|nr:Xylose transporter, permease protein XylH [Gaiellaceae bacterium]